MFNLPDEIIELQNAAITASIKRGQIVLVLGLPGQRETQVFGNVDAAIGVGYRDPESRPYAVARDGQLCYCAFNEKE